MDSSQPTANTEVIVSESFAALSPEDQSSLAEIMNRAAADQNCLYPPLPRLRPSTASLTVDPTGMSSRHRDRPDLLAEVRCGCDRRELVAGRPRAVVHAKLLAALLGHVGHDYGLGEAAPGILVKQHPTVEVA